VLFRSVKDVAVEEIYSLDSAEQKKEKCYGLIFLFKWKPELASSDDREVMDSTFIPELFFARQIVTNACATQAILGILLNTETIVLGEDLTDFKSFTSSLDAESKGIAIGNSDSIRVAHNSFARAEPFFFDSSQKRTATSSDDIYHFVAYIPFRDGVYELDGLKSGPIFLGDCGDVEGDWWKVAQPAIEARMNRYSAAETHFALMSVCEKRSGVLEKEIAELTSQIEVIDGVAGGGELGPDGTAAMIDLGARESILGTIETLRMELLDENTKTAKQREENVRRRHNYLPMIIDLLKGLSKKGALDGMIDAAQKAKQTSGGSNK